MMNTQQNTQIQIEYWTNMYINHNDTYNNWCPQSIKDEVEEEEENDCCIMCLHPKCECKKYYICNNCNGPFACFLDVDEIICAGEEDTCSSCYGIKCYTCNEFKYWENFEDELTEVKHEDETNFKNKFDKVINELNNLDKKHYCNKHFNRYMKLCNYENVAMLLFKSLRNDVRHKNVFGILDITTDFINYRKNNKLGLVCIDRGNLKNGIEILNMRIGKNNQTQKYNYGRYEEEDEIKRHTITELKTFCKMNSIKGYSKFDKLKVVQSLMKL